MTKAIKIVINRAEGPTRECGQKQVEGSDGIWERANNLLREWSWTAPGLHGKREGYDKCDFWIHWEDGEVYEGRYDLVHPDRESPSLEKHIRDFLTFIGGMRKPAHLTQEQYDRYIDSEKRSDPKLVENVKTYLATYQIGDQVPVA